MIKNYTIGNNNKIFAKAHANLDYFYGPWESDLAFVSAIVDRMVQDPTLSTLVDVNGEFCFPIGMKYAVINNSEIIEKIITGNITTSDVIINQSTGTVSLGLDYDSKVSSTALLDSNYLKESDLSDLYYTYDPEDSTNARYTNLGNAVNAHKIIKVGKYIALVKDTYHQDYGGYVEYEISYLDEDKNLHVITDNGSVNYGSPILFVSLPVEYNTTTLNYVPSYGTSGQVLSTNGTDGVAWTTITPGVTAENVNSTWYSESGYEPAQYANL